MITRIAQMMPVIVDIIPIPADTVPPTMPAAAWTLVRQITPCPPDPALTLVAAGLAARVLGNLSEVRPVGRYHRVLLVVAAQGNRHGDPLLPLPLCPQPDRWWDLLREAVRIGTLVGYGWQRPGWEWERAVRRCVDAARLTAGEKQVVESVLWFVGAGEQMLSRIMELLGVEDDRRGDDRRGNPQLVSGLLPGLAHP